MAAKRTGDGLELTYEEHIHAATVAFSPCPDEGRRSPLLKISEIVEELNSSRRAVGKPEVGPDTVNRAIRRAVENRWVLARPRQLVDPGTKRTAALEKELADRFKIDDVVVIDCEESGVAREDFDLDSSHARLGLALAEHVAAAAKYEFRKSVRRSWGIGRGIGVRAFAEHLSELSEGSDWPAQRVYSLGGNLSDQRHQLRGRRVVCEADDNAATFASCFDRSAELFRTSQPLVVDKEQRDGCRARTRLDDFGQDRYPTAAVLGLQLGTPDMLFERMTDKLDTDLAREIVEDATEFNRTELGMLWPNNRNPVVSLTGDLAKMPLAVVDERYESVSGKEGRLSELQRFLVCASVEDLQRADQIYLLGCGLGSETALYELLTSTFAGKVTAFATSVVTAEQIMEVSKKASPGLVPLPG